MFRPINSDDHTKFRPPLDHVRQSDAAHHGQKRDFSYEVEHVQEKEDEKHRQSNDFGEDSFESSADRGEQDSLSSKDKSQPQNIDKADGHVDLQA